MKKKYLICEAKDLKSEADVEAFFILPLLKKLGFKNSNIKNKHSLESLSVKSIKGSKKELYKPDFAIVINKKTRLIVEAKAPSENLDKHISQPREYTSILNGEDEEINPVRYYILSNGVETKVFRHDYNKSVLDLTLDDFSDGNRKFEKLKEITDSPALKSEEGKDYSKTTFRLFKSPLQDVNAAFSWCHQYIYRTDNISQGAAFTEFVKLIALKLSSDRDIREKYKDQMDQEEIHVSPNDVKFSIRWIEQREGDTPNPVDSILFDKFLKDMELEIEQKRRKRIFDKGDHIRLSPETIRGVVERLEQIFLFGIDADLNGRLFETFLNATMRGKDLGQYFTPRSIVKLGVGLARLYVDPDDLKGKSVRTDRVIDACCGTGGFLIDALADMWRKVDLNNSLSDMEKSKLRHQIANNHLFGIDVGKDPNLSRIARLNMYLHGDGGTSIFNTDALDKTLPVATHDSTELALEKEQLLEIYEKGNGFFDVALTNPPFAKVYKLDGTASSEKENKSSSSRILKLYDLRSQGSSPDRKSLKSSMMFFERYHDLLKPGGQLISVIDDGLLSGAENKWFRIFLLERFVLRAVISLPGDAFQRSKARVKTSLAVLIKKQNVDETQSDVFMFPCRHVGIDDPARQRTLPIDAYRRELARQEISDVLKEYEHFCTGKGSKKYTVDGKSIEDRLDVKNCLMEKGARLPEWKRKKLPIYSLDKLVALKEFQPDDVIHSNEHDGTVTYVRVRYDGLAEIGEEVDPSDTTYSQMWRVSQGDIVISNIAATYGSVAVIDDVTDGCVVTNEYTVLTAKDNFHPLTIWAILRSQEARSEFLLSATGANRTRVKWELIRDIVVPYPSLKQAEEFAASVESLNMQEKEIRKAREDKINSLKKSLDLDTDHASLVLEAFKPPK